MKVPAACRVNLRRPVGRLADNDGTDPTVATPRVIASSLLVIGLDNALCGKKAFINLGRGLLVDGFSLMLPKESTVIEVLENVEPDSEMLAACERLRRQGYPIALDDFVGTPNNEPLAGTS